MLAQTFFCNALAEAIARCELVGMRVRRDRRTDGGTEADDIDRSIERSNGCHGIRVDKRTLTVVITPKHPYGKDHMLAVHIEKHFFAAGWKGMKF